MLIYALNCIACEMSKSSIDVSRSLCLDKTWKLQFLFLILPLKDMTVHT